MLGKSLAMAISIAGVALLCQPTPAVAQGECPVICVCNPPYGCHCETLPNGGGVATDCVAGGMYNCNLIYCYDPEDPGGLVFTPDGAVMRVGELFADLHVKQDAERGLRTLRGKWRTVSPGEAVAESCTGLVVARFFKPEVAAELRKQSLKLAV